MSETNNSNHTSEQSPAVHDENYYFEDGNCILRAEGYLFNIHRSLLERNSTFFKNMFDLRATSSQEYGALADFEGSSDEKPINCPDTTEAIRSLCWLLYANPQEICAQHEPEHSDFKKLVQIVLIAHKYECTTFETWATHIIFEHIPVGRFQEISIANLEHFLSIASQSNWKGLVLTVQGDLIDRILLSNDPLATLSTVLDIAEREGDRDFQAEAYCAYLCAPRREGASPTSCTHHSPSQGRSEKARKEETVVQTSYRVSTSNVRSSLDRGLLHLNGLSDIRKFRLFCGYHSLMELRNQLREYPVLGNCSAGGCESRWRDWWYKQQEQLGEGTSSLDDPRSFLQEMRRRIGNGRKACSDYARGSKQQEESEGCEEERKAEIMALRDAIQDSLADRFMFT